MRIEKNDPIIRNALQSLCCSNGWSYGVFWSSDQRNSLLLTLEDAYYEDHMGFVIDNMLLQVHMLGNGVVGQAAFTKKHQWMFSDCHSGGQILVGSNRSQDIFQDVDSEFHHQFSSGIQTVAVISVEPQGVIQFGSTQKIPESMEFVNQTKRMFQEMGNGNGLIQSENAPSSSNSEIYGHCGGFASSILGDSCPGHMKLRHGAGSKIFMETAYSSPNLTQSSLPSLDHRKIAPLIWNSHHLGNLMQVTQKEAPLKYVNKSTTQLQQPLLQSNAQVTCIATQASCISTWSNGESTLTSSEQQLPSEMGVPGSQHVFAPNPKGLGPCRGTVQICPDSTSTSRNSIGELVKIDKTSQSSSGIDQQHSPLPFRGIGSTLSEISTSPCTFQEIFQVSDFATALSNACPLDDISQWLVRSPESNNAMGTTLSDSLSEAMRFTPVSCGLNVANALSETPVNHVANSVLGSVTSILPSDGQGKCSGLFGIENDLFDNFGLDFGCGQSGDLLDDILMPVETDGHLDYLDIITDPTEFISERHIGSMASPQNRLFSKLGLEELLDSVTGTSASVARSSLRDEISSTTKRRRIGSSSAHGDQVQLAGLPCFGGKPNLLQPVYKMESSNNLDLKKEAILKSEVNSWIGDHHSINGRSTVISQPSREEPAKVTKKKSKPGTRPRPRDRQQIQDRVNELRELIPNGAKMSIDSLLAQTIKHMLFLQSVTKHADELKEADEPKMIEQENKVVVKVNSGSGGGSGGGVTWAYEFGSQTMVCPLVVEDLSPPGKMLIEMLCEEQGFFLEIVDIIRGFGLTILKGVMQLRKNTLWARFIIESEASRHVARVEIFMALVQLLQPSDTSEIKASGKLGNAADSGTYLFKNYQQPVVPLPVSLADTLC